MDRAAVDRYFYWITERHRIYQRRAAGEPPPWTVDPILQEYKFTNPFRENDRVTVWMRQNWTGPHSHEPIPHQIFNVCFFRQFGTIEFAQAHGWVYEFNPKFTMELARSRLEKGERVFTGAYIITNQGLKLPKEEVVCEYFLRPIWEQREDLQLVTLQDRRLEALHTYMKQFQGWGGGGFMSYEVVTDLNYTPVLRNATDRFTWANAGPGAVRGLNRMHGRPLEKPIKKTEANAEMLRLLELAHWELQKPGFPYNEVDMRCIEHSLCEWDKYERVLLGEGRPRSRFDQDLVRLAGDHVKGPIP